MVAEIGEELNTQLRVRQGMWSASIRSKGIETARIGIIAPNSGSTTEATFTSAAPDGVSFVFTGLGPLPRIDGSIAPALRDIGLPRIEEAAEFLETLGCDIICMNGSIVGWLNGVDFDTELIDRMETATGLPATTNSTAIAAALSELGAEQVTIVTSYDPTTLDIATSALTELGYELDTHSLDRRGDVADDVQLSTDRIYRYTIRSAREAIDPDCILLLGGAIPSLTLLDDLEYDLDVPVVSDGQAALFQLFRTLEIDSIDGYGGLLERV